MAKGQRFVDITGQEFGNLVAVKFIGHNHISKQLWQFECKICKSLKIKVANNVKSNPPESCGCTRYKNNHKNLKKDCNLHGMSHTNVYQRWKGMRQRCNNKEAINYDNYGGRGIKICERWNNFTNFYLDMGEPPSKEHSIERLDNNGDYCPENCVWATRDVQNNNKRNCKFITYNGKTQTISQWAEELCKDKIIINKDSNIDECGKYKTTILLKYNDKVMNIKEWANELNIDKYMIYYKLYTNENSVSIIEDIQQAEQNEEVII